SEVKLWDAATGRELFTLRAPPFRLASLAFGPDGLVAAAGWLGELTVWDTATGKTLRSWGGHSPDPRALAFSPDGRLLAGAGSNGPATNASSRTGPQAGTAHPSYLSQGGPDRGRTVTHN